MQASGTPGHRCTPAGSGRGGSSGGGVGDADGAAATATPRAEASAPAPAGATAPPTEGRRRRRGRRRWRGRRRRRRRGRRWRRRRWRGRRWRPVGRAVAEPRWLGGALTGGADVPAVPKPRPRGIRVPVVEDLALALLLARRVGVAPLRLLALANRLDPERLPVARLRMRRRRRGRRLRRRGRRRRRRRRGCRRRRRRGRGDADGGGSRRRRRRGSDGGGGIGIGDGGPASHRRTGSVGRSPGCRRRCCTCRPVSGLGSSSFSVSALLSPPCSCRRFTPLRLVELANRHDAERRPSHGRRRRGRRQGRRRRRRG